MKYLMAVAILLASQMSFANTNKVLLARDLPIEQVSFRVVDTNFIRFQVYADYGRYVRFNSGAAIAKTQNLINQMSAHADYLNQRAIRLAKKCNTVHIVLNNPSANLGDTPYKNVGIEPGSNCSR